MEHPIVPSEDPGRNKYTLRQYHECIESAVHLQQWMLNPIGYRIGTFKKAFTPFYNNFLKLYQSSRHHPELIEFDHLKSRIDKWILKSKGVMTAPETFQDRISSIGLKLFELWSEKLLIKNIIS